MQKPGCKAEVMEYFRRNPDSGVTSPSQIAIVGDRLFTDVMMANMMGSYGFWVKDGIIERKSFVSLIIQLESKNDSRFLSLPVWKIGCPVSCSSEATRHPTRGAISSKVSSHALI
jgi:hypothetical protein